MTTTRKVRGRVVVPNLAPTEAPVAAASELADTLKSIRKQLGDTAAVKGSEIPQPERISTGVFVLDMALGGGIMRGKINDFSGAKHSGKTAGSLRTLGLAQRIYPEETHVLVDMEHTFDATWATCLGVDVEKLIVIHPDTGEQAVDAIEALMRTRDVGLLVLDSVAALIPFKVQDTSAEDNDTPGIHAKLVTKLMSKVNSALLAESKRGHYPTMLCTNQYRSGIGMWAPPGQEALKFTGGKAYEHYLSSRVIFKNKENLERDEHGIDTLSYNEHAFRIDKNKFNAGTRAGEFQMVRRAGVVEPLTAGDLDDASTLVSIAKKMKVYDGGGRSWALYLPGESIKVGKADELVAMLYEDKDLHDRLYAYLVALHCRKIGLPDYHVKRIHPDA